MDRETITCIFTSFFESGPDHGGNAQIMFHLDLISSFVKVWTLEVFVVAFRVAELMVESESIRS